MNNESTSRCIGKELSAELRDLARTHPVSVLTGPRQVGKCRLAKRPSGHAMRGVERQRAMDGETVAHGFVACTTEGSFDLAPDITAVNGWRTWPLAD